MIKNIFFDFFGVISSEVSSIWLDKYFTNLEERITFKESWFPNVDIGKVSMKETYDYFSKKFNLPKEQIEKEWFDLAVINQDMVNLIKKLKEEKYNIYLLSNAEYDYLNQIMIKNNLHGLFNKEYISSSIKRIKPNEDFFLYVLNDLNVSPEECIFIDDNKNNTARASELNIHTFTYKNNICEFYDCIKKVDN